MAFAPHMRVSSASEALNRSVRPPYMRSALPPVSAVRLQQAHPSFVSDGICNLESRIQLLQAHWTHSLFDANPKNSKDFERLTLSFGHTWYMNSEDTVCKADKRMADYFFFILDAFNYFPETALQIRIKMIN
jgi:hypothetical protein